MNEMKWEVLELAVTNLLDDFAEAIIDDCSVEGGQHEDYYVDMNDKIKSFIVQRWKLKVISIMKTLPKIMEVMKNVNK